MSNYFTQFSPVKIVHCTESQWNETCYVILFIIILLLMISQNKKLKKIMREKKFINNNPINMVIYYINNILHNHYKHLIVNKLFVFYFISFFLFLLILNFIGLFPYILPVTSLFFYTFCFGLSCWLPILGSSFFFYNLNYLSIFMPEGSPIYLSPLLVLVETISQLVRPLTLALRLAANITAGHLLLTIISNFAFGSANIFAYLNFGMSLSLCLFSVILVLLEVCVLIIQAYIFTLLLTIYITEINIVTGPSFNIEINNLGRLIINNKYIHQNFKKDNNLNFYWISNYKPKI